MADLTLSLALPQARVVSGENFPVKIKITNTGRAAGPAPTDFGDEDYRFALAPASGGDTIVLTRRAFENSAVPGDPTERLAPPTAPISEELAAGESRVAQVYPARLAARPIPAGDYALTVSLLSTPAVISVPIRLTVEASNIVGYHATGSGPMSGSALTFVHHDGSGANYLFGGTGTAQAPTLIAGLRLAQIAGPIKGMQFSHAEHAGDISGPLMVAWLSGDGNFFAAVAQSAYVVARSGPLDLGLSAPQLAPAGWKTGDRYFAAAFAVLGKRGPDMELALISLDRAGNWAPKVRRIALALPGMPKVWRLSQRMDGGLVLFAAYPRDNGATILKLDIAASGAAPGRAVELLRTDHPVVALSAPLMVAPDSTLQSLSGPGMTVPRNGANASAAWAFHAIPINGGAAGEKRFDVPLVDGVAPSNWSLAESAPKQAALIARIGSNLYSIRIGDAPIKLIDMGRKPGAQDIASLVVGTRAWAIWRSGSERIESYPFPR